MADPESAAFELRAIARGSPVVVVFDAVPPRWAPALFAFDDPLLARAVAWLPLELDAEWLPLELDAEWLPLELDAEWLPLGLDAEGLPLELDDEGLPLELDEDGALEVARDCGEPFSL